MLAGVMTLLDQNHGKSTKTVEDPVSLTHYVTYVSYITKLGSVILLYSLQFILLHNYNEDFLLTVVIQIWFCLL